MAEYVIKGMGEVGVTPDVAAFDMQPNAFDDAMNCRFANGMIEKVGGHTRLSFEEGDQNYVYLNLVYSPFDYYSAPATNPQFLIGATGIITKKTAGDDETIQESKLYRIDENGGFVDISQRDANGNPITYNASESSPWYDCMVSNCIVMNNANNVPQVKEFYTMGSDGKPVGEATNYFVDLPGWGEQTDTFDPTTKAGITTKRSWRCGRVRAFNNRLFAMDMWEAGPSGVREHYPLRVRWSNFSEENQAPTLWDDLVANRDPESFAAAVKNGYAGWADMADSKGTIQDILPLNNYLFIYTENEVYQAYPTNRADMPFQFKKLYNDMGALAPGCVVEVDGKHLVVTQHDVVMHNGVSRRSIAVNRIRDKLIDEISSVNPMATKCYLYNDRKEVWIAYVKPGSPRRTWACNKAAVYNWEFDTWSFMDVPGAYSFCLTDPPILIKAPSWADMSDKYDPDLTWDDERLKNIPWQIRSQNYKKQITVVSTAGKGIIQLDNGKFTHKWTSKGFDQYGNRNWFWKVEPVKLMVARKCIDFDNATNEWNMKHVQSMYLQALGTGNCTFTYGGSQSTGGGSPDKHGSNTYTVGESRKINCRLNHKYLGFKIEDNDLFSTVKFGDMIITYTVGGKR